MVIRWDHGHILSRAKTVKCIFFPCQLLVNIKHVIVLQRQRTVQRWGKTVGVIWLTYKQKHSFCLGEKTNILIQALQKWLSLLNIIGITRRHAALKWLSYLNFRRKASSLQSLNPRLQNCSLPPSLSSYFIQCILGLLLALPKLHPPVELLQISLAELISHNCLKLYITSITI